MKVSGHDATAVIYVHNVAGKKEIVDERDNTAVGCRYGSPFLSGEVNAKVTASYGSIESSS